MTDNGFERVWRAIGRRFARWRTTRALAELNKHQLRDIGLSPDDVRVWSERLQAMLARDDAAEKCRRALRGLGDDQLVNLSEAGLRAWRAARRQVR
jgi:uncharacterized protein YjiS (DUF1127 family)